MKRKSIIYTGSIEVTYDPESQDFKDSLESYIDVIDSGGTEATMLEHIVYGVVKNGVDQMVEGVGYVQVQGRDKPKDDFSGVMIAHDWHDVFID